VADELVLLLVGEHEFDADLQILLKQVVDSRVLIVGLARRRAACGRD